MTCKLLTPIALFCVLAAVGCNSAPAGTRRVLGAVAYDRAFSESRRIMWQYFSLDESDHRAGKIKSRPRLVEQLRRRAGRTPARQIATLQLRRDGKFIVAYLAVIVQSQYSNVHKRLKRDEENYSGVPSRTPAEIEAATTFEQNITWRQSGYDHKLERTILDELTKALTPEKNHDE